MNEADLTLCIMAGTFCGLGHFVVWYFKLLGTFGVTFCGLVRSVAGTFCKGILCYGTCGGRTFCRRYI
jgi:hypothetical protein